MLVIIRSCNCYLFQGLVVVQTESQPVSKIFLTVIGIVYVLQGNRHEASAHCEIRTLKDQVSIEVIDMHGARPSGVLAVIVPEIFQTGIICICNINARTHVLIAAVTVRRKKTCIP
ncbi:unknown [Ruminococcus sp. CAG:60]|nr:unknown [Ruminococcus sp. CAG:60]